MPQAGRIAFGRMEAVTFGKPAAEAVAEEARRCEAERVFLMVSGTLNRMTDEIAQVRRGRGNRRAGVFGPTPPPTPRPARLQTPPLGRRARRRPLRARGGGPR